MFIWCKKALTFKIRECLFDRHVVALGNLFVLPCNFSFPFHDLVLPCTFDMHAEVVLEADHTFFFLETLFLQS